MHSSTNKYEMQFSSFSLYVFFLPATLSPLNQLLRRIEALLITAPVSSVAARLSISPNIIQSLTKLRRARFTSFFGPRSLRFQFKIFDRRRLLLFANAYVGVRPVENTNTSMCARSAHNFARLVRWQLRKAKKESAEKCKAKADSKLNKQQTNKAEAKRNNNTPAAAVVFVCVGAFGPERNGKFEWQCKIGSRIANCDFPAKRRSLAQEADAAEEWVPIAQVQWLRPDLMSSTLWTTPKCLITTGDKAHLHIIISHCPHPIGFTSATVKILWIELWWYQN